MATGEESDDESLGGAEMHARTSGLADYLAVDEPDAIRIGRRIVARLNWRKRGPAPSADAAEPAPRTMSRSCSASCRPTCGPRSTRARSSRRIVDGSDFDEFKPLYGTAWSPAGPRARLPGRHPGQRAGVLFSEESQKAAQFIQLANQADTPLIFLHNTTGYMVGARVRAGRDHQARRDDDQCGVQLRRAAPLDPAGRLLRRRALRHVRPRL